MQWEFWDYDVSASDSLPIRSVTSKSQSTLMNHAPSSKDCLQGLPLIQKRTYGRATSFIDDTNPVFMLSAHKCNGLNHPSQDTSQGGPGDEAIQGTIVCRRKSNLRRKTVASEHPVWINKWQGKYRDNLSEKSSVECDQKDKFDKNPFKNDSNNTNIPCPASTRPKSGSPPAA